MSFDDIADRADHYRDVAREQFTASNGVVIEEAGDMFYIPDASPADAATALREYFNTIRDTSIYNTEPQEQS